MDYDKEAMEKLADQASRDLRDRENAARAVAYRLARARQLVMGQRDTTVAMLGIAREVPGVSAERVQDASDLFSRAFNILIEATSA